MIPRTPGPDPASCPFGQATPPDGARLGGGWPTAIHITHDELMRGLNPLQHVPVVGMIYRLATHETIPAPMRVLGAGLVGGPLGALMAGFMGIVEAIATMPPDLSRPSAPAGMSATGSEQGVSPITPGTLAPGAYTTLATTQPEWLSGGTQFAAEPARGAAAYQAVESEWARTESLEKGLA